MTEEDEIAAAALRLLPPQDVSAIRALRLRERCHRELRRRTRAAREPRAAHTWRRMVAPAMIGAWSAVYLFVMLRAAAAVYGF